MIDYRKMPHFDEPIISYMRVDFPLLHPEMSIQEALDAIREKGLGEQIIYFYVVDREMRLIGVLPTRRILTGDLAAKIDDIMIKRVVTLSDRATILDACEMFVMYRLLALPVVDQQRRLVGIVDIHLFTEEVFDLLEREQADAIFEYIGFRISQVRDASPLKVFRYRFPWLLATIASGLLCALLTGMFRVTLETSIMLAFFLTLALGLGESAAIQSMTVAIQNLRMVQPRLSWYRKSLIREMLTAALLGMACAFIIAGVVYFAERTGPFAVAIAGGIMLAMMTACFLGLTVPTILHR